MRYWDVWVWKEEIDRIQISWIKPQIRYDRICHCEARSNLFIQNTLQMSNSDNEIVPIVDINDEIIWYKARKNITKDDICRITWCRITDGEGKILLAQRAWTKKSNPWKRWPAVAWTVAKWESYWDSIIKEIKEEIGLDIDSTDLQIKVKRYSEYNKKMLQRFTLQYRGAKDQLIKQDSEVEALKRYTPQTLKHEIETKPEIFTLWTIRAFNNL